LDNYSKARDRLKMSLEDLRRDLARYLEGDYPDAVFRFQLSVENACKSVLSFLDIEFKKPISPASS
jgi:HEPN domain-containing protein